MTLRCSLPGVRALLAIVVVSALVAPLAATATPPRPASPRWASSDVPVSDVRRLFPGDQKNLYEASVAIDPTNPRVLLAFAIDLSTQNVDPDMYSTNRGFRSTDGGRSWKDMGHVRYSRDPKQVWGGGDPVVTFDSRGTAYFASLATPPGGGGGIYVHRSTNAGASWGLPVLAVGEECDAETNQQLSTDKEWLSTDPRTGRLYLTYTGLLRSCTSTGVPESTVDSLLRLSDMGIFFTTSNDGGRTWSKPGKIWDGYALGSIPKVGPDGTLHVTFWSAALAPTTCPGAVGLVLASVGGGPATAITLGSSKDGGRTWRFDQQPVCGFEAGETSHPGRFVGGSFLPSLAVDRSSGAAYVAYSDFEPTGARFSVQLTRSTDRGVSWSAPVTVPTSGDDARMPTLLADGGALRLLYTQTTGTRDQDETTVDGTADLMSVESFDGGATWTEPFRVSTASGQPKEYTELGDYIGFDAVKGQVVTVWTDARDSERGQIRSRVATLVSPSAPATRRATTSASPTMTHAASTWDWATAVWPDHRSVADKPWLDASHIGCVGAKSAAVQRLLRGDSGSVVVRCSVAEALAELQQRAAVAGIDVLFGEQEHREADLVLADAGRILVVTIRQVGRNRRRVEITL